MLINKNLISYGCVAIWNGLQKLKRKKKKKEMKRVQSERLNGNGGMFGFPPVRVCVHFLESLSVIKCAKNHVFSLFLVNTDSWLSVWPNAVRFISFECQTGKLAARVLFEIKYRNRRAGTWIFDYTFTSAIGTPFASNIHFQKE